MLLIPAGREPESPVELQSSLNAGVTEVFGLAGGGAARVQVQGSWTRLELLSVDLGGVRIDPLRPPSVPTGLGAVGKAASLASERFDLEARPLFLGELGQLELSVEALDVEYAFARDAGGRLWLVPQHFSSGTVKVGMHGRDLEQVFLGGVRQAAVEHGVTIEEAGVRLEQSGPLELRLEAELLARKLLVKSRILLCGRVSFDEQLNVRFRELGCSGKGMVAAIACRFLEPHLEAWEDRSWPLLSLAFPAVRLRDARLKTDGSGRLEATAELG